MYYFVMRNPIKTMYLGEVANDMLNESMPPATPVGQIWYMATHTDDLP